MTTFFFWFFMCGVYGYGCAQIALDFGISKWLMMVLAGVVPVIISFSLKWS